MHMGLNIKPRGFPGQPAHNPYLHSNQGLKAPNGIPGELRAYWPGNN